MTTAAQTYLARQAEAVTDRMTPRDTADLIGVTVATLADWRCSGRYSLPFRKIGSKIYYSRRAVMAWLEERDGTCVAGIRAALAIDFRHAGAKKTPARFTPGRLRIDDDRP